MPRAEKKNYLNISLLNEFLYAQLFNASAEDKRNLSGKYLAACENIKSAKKFINSATREEKEYILAHFGYQFLYAIVPYRISRTELKDFFSNTRRISDLKKEGFYIHSDREIMHQMGLTAKAVHDGAYGLNMELLRQSYHVKKWSRRMPLKDEVKEVSEGDAILMRTLLAASITMNYQQGITGISDIQLQILLYLYLKRNKVIKWEEVDALFAGYKGRYKPSGFKAAINSLVLNQFVQRSIVDKSLTITSLGIKKCVEYRDAVLVNNNNL
jgi:hypothetical protein